MSSTTAEMANTTAEGSSRAQQRLWAVPAVLSALMISSGVFFVLIAYGISILSSVSY